MLNFHPKDIPLELRSLPQWVLWKAEPRGGRTSKVPYRLDGWRASSTDLDGWTDFESACQACVSGQGQYSGVGFVFTASDNICGVDLDHVVGGDGQADPWVSRMVAVFGSYTEYSVSGQGLHIFCRGVIPEGSRHRREPVEIYDRGRFFTVTGRPYGEPKPLRDAQPEIDRLLKWMKPEEPKPQAPPVRVSACPDDRRLLHKMASAKNGYKFARLWRGDASDYGGDDSRADLALLSMLLFWTRGDESRSDALFRQSGLSRDKWTKRPDYRERCFRHMR